MGELTCAEVRDVLPELSLGVLSGEERGDVLRHVDRCESCRMELERYARTSDALLHIAPAAEPPSGFEEGVLARMTPTRTSRRWYIVAAAALMAAIVGVAATYVAGAHDRHLANEYAEALHTLHGTSLRTGELNDTRGNIIGQVTLYEGHPSWVFVAVEHGHATADATIRLVSRSGTTVVRGLHISAGHGALGSVVGADVESVRAVVIVDSAGRTLGRAPLPRT